ncbi:MAG TPA: terpene synthase family protein [Streptosporangiaceae bacterium]
MTAQPVRAAGSRDAPAALACGRICAVAGQGQRELREWAAAYPGLYGAEIFDPALYSTVALAAAFSGPERSAAELRMANRACLWCFGLDWLIDHVATTRHEVDAIVGRCAAVADGAPTAEADELTAFLADLRDEVAVAAAGPALRGVWRDELGRMLRAMAREWVWNAARAAGDSRAPTFDEYLDNADNLAFSFVFTTFWISVAGPVEDAAIGPVRAAMRAVQRVVRLLNDLGSYERDLAWDDLNALRLGVPRAEVNRRLAELTARARSLVAVLRDGHPRLADHADYLERQMDFCAGFYGISDFWGKF